MEEARISLDRILVLKNLTVNTMAKDMGLSWVTLNKFINDDAMPQTNTFLRMLAYIELNKELL